MHTRRVRGVTGSCRWGCLFGREQPACERGISCFHKTAGPILILSVNIFLRPLPILICMTATWECSAVVVVGPAEQRVVATPEHGKSDEGTGLNSSSLS